MDAPLHTASEEWIKTIGDDKGYANIEAAPYLRLLKRMNGYAFFRAVLRNVQPGQNVLEGGCGWAFSSFALAEYGVNATALDISEKLIADLQKLRNELGGTFAKHVKPVVGDIFRLPELHTMYDAFISDGTYEHFLDSEDRRKILASVSAVLKPGGIVVIAVPNLHNPFFGSVVDPKMPAMHPFTLQSLSDELKEGGFRIIETGYSFVNPGFEQWTTSKLFILPIRAANLIFRFLPRALKSVLAAHLYCVAQKT